MLMSAVSKMPLDAVPAATVTREAEKKFSSNLNNVLPLLCASKLTTTIAYLSLVEIHSRYQQATIPYLNRKLETVV